MKKTNVLKPEIDESVFIAEGARIYGDVRIEAGSSVWFNAVIRGDEGKITIGTNTNIQDNVVIHSDMMTPVEIGDQATIGHGAVIRSCKIGSHVMVGMNATVMSHANIGDHSIVGAHAFVPYNKTFPPGSLIVGAPARFIRALNEEEIEGNKMVVKIYEDLALAYTHQKIVGYRNGK